MLYAIGICDCDIGNLAWSLTYLHVRGMPRQLQRSVRLHAKHAISSIRPFHARTEFHSRVNYGTIFFAVHLNAPELDVIRDGTSYCSTEWKPRKVLACLCLLGVSHVGSSTVFDRSAGRFNDTIDKRPEQELIGRSSKPNDLATATRGRIPASLQPHGGTALSCRNTHGRRKGETSYTSYTYLTHRTRRLARRPIAGFVMGAGKMMRGEQRCAGTCLWGQTCVARSFGGQDWQRDDGMMRCLLGACAVLRVCESLVRDGLCLTRPFALCARSRRLSLPLHHCHV